jgi:sec-independent protein translocase protein TatB
MFDMSWGEIMVIGAIALIVIGPKDLPRTLRTVGNMIGKVRRMAADFQGQFNEAMREAELDDVKRQIQGVNDSVSSLNTSFNPVQTIRDEIKGAIEAKPDGTPETKVGVYDAPAEAGSPVPVADVSLPPPPEAPPVDLSSLSPPEPSTPAPANDPQPKLSEKAQ